jgi:LacI family transcriptional regulator
VNLRDVAYLAGVSRSTVSRVINDDRKVSDEARRRVQEVIRAHNFQPNAAARSLASRRTRILGLFVPASVSFVFGDPFFPKLLQGAVEACTEADYNLMMLMDPSGDIEGMYNRVVGGRHIDGIVVASSVIEDPFVARLHYEGFPFVLVGRHPYYQKIRFVDVDNRGTAREIVSHLLAHGYRRIAFIGGSEAMIHAVDRYGGYVSAMLEAGLAPDKDLVRHADYTNEGGYRAMRDILDHEPEAVFAASDLMALGAMRALREAGVRVPEDVAVMGFDGIEEGALAQPPLSTAVQDVQEIGRQAVRMLLRAIEEPDGEFSHETLPVRLEIRHSCGCPTGDAGLAR